MTLNRREQILITVIAGIVVLGGTWGVGASLAQRWRDTRNQVSTRRRELTAMRVAIGQKSQWQGEVERLRQGLGQQEQALNQMSDLLKRIDEVGAASGIIISSRRPQPVAERGAYRELPLQCAFEATTESLVRFLYALQTGASVISVDQLQVAPRPDNSGILRGEIQLRALTSRAVKGSS